MFPILGVCFLVLSILLGLSIILLIYRLKVKQKQLEQSGVVDVFGNEIWTLVAILIIFSTSYLIRFFFDIWIYDKIYKPRNHHEFGNYILGVSVQYIWNLIPIGAIVLSHRHNFSKRQDTKSSIDNQSRYSHVSLHLIDLTCLSTEEQIRSTIS